MVLLNITTERSRFDLNVTPDKRTVMVQQEAQLLDVLRRALEDVWDPSKWQYTQSLEQGGDRGTERRASARMTHTPAC